MAADGRLTNAGFGVKVYLAPARNWRSEPHLRLLVLGGTVFVGRHIVEHALGRGDDVTLFNRGRTNPDLFPRATKLRGDRKQDLTAVQDGRWDAVIDTCGYLPADVQRSATALKGLADSYTFISTLSVYQEPLASGLDETGPTARLKGNPTQVNGETYGPLKAACERAAAESFGKNVLVIRPGLIVGPHDPTERFTYWPRRLARGGDVLAPGDPSRQVQFIDARDLAAWTLESIENGHTGTYNATGPRRRLKMKTSLERIGKSVGADANLVWVEDEFLVEAGVAPFTGLPLWLPQSHNGVLEVSVAKAVEDGLRFRPLSKTAADTLAWDRERGDHIHKGPAIDPARELALLQAWRARQAMDS